MTDRRTPYRVIVFARGERLVGRGRQRRAMPASYAFVAWTPEQHYQEARLPSAGSFLFPGVHAARAEAMRHLADPAVQQVSVRTDQDRQVYRYFRNADGTVGGYGEVL